MKKVLIKIGVAAAGLLAVFLIIGLLLPEENRVEAKLTVPRSLERVWNRFVQTERWVEWFSIIRSVEKISMTPDGVGSRFQIVSVLPGGQEVVSAVEVTDWIEGRIYAHRHLSDIMKGRSLPITNVMARFEFEPAGREGTRVVFTGTFEAQGIINKWFARLLFKPRIEEAISHALTNSTAIWKK